jgi:hypothetical protein
VPWCLQNGGPLRPILLAALCLVLGAMPLTAQAFRVRSVTTMRYAELRPIHYDSASGTFVTDPVASAIPLTEDIEVSGWGFGVEGLRAYALVRGRAALGSELVWPRYGEHFDALWAFLELDRPRWRVRAGRQQRASGLGVYGFDGLTATVRPLPTIRVEAYGGRGLARGFLEPQNSAAITSLDPLLPNQGTILVGTSLWAAPSPGSSFSAIYQRELLSDRSALVSERAALDARVTVGPAVLSGSADADLATSTWGKARLGALVRVGRRSFAEVEVFRYKPLLDLSTIWGVFSPEAHKGASASLHFSPLSQLSVSTTYSYRKYEPVTAGAPFVANLHDDASLFSVSGRWQAGDLSTEGSYTLQTGYGGIQSGGDVGVAYSRQGGWRLGGRASAFQTDEAFRVTDGTVYGLGAEARGPVGDRAFLRAEVMRYLHRRMSGQTGIDWNQTRALVSFEVTFGSNPDRIGAPR